MVVLSQEYHDPNTFHSTQLQLYDRFMLSTSHFITACSVQRLNRSFCEGHREHSFQTGVFQLY